MKLRATAATILQSVICEHHSLTDALAQQSKTFSNPRDTAWLQAICFGVCRHYFYLDAVLLELLDKPLKDDDIYCLLLVGLYQLIDTRVPNHAAVAATVEATVVFKKEWAKGLVNAVLRNFIRKQEAILDLVSENKLAQFDHSDWMIEKIKSLYPKHWEEILTENNQHPPLCLRVNLEKISRDDYLVLLQQKECEALPIEFTNSGIELATPMGVSELPKFSDGFVSVQDGAGQLAAELLELAPGLSVLDACSAPGGKLSHIAESQPNLASLIAVDNDAKRLDRVLDNLTRLQLKAECVVADANELDFAPATFDRILLDAPCSATGVIRRHPDIKILRDAEQIKTLTEIQLTLLNNLWPLLKPGGILIYATCSIFPEENNELVASFLKITPTAEEKIIDASWGLPCKIGRQLLPGMHGMDGFYYAKLRKIS